MSLNYTNLVTKGRAHSPGRPWTAEEMEALVKISHALNLDFSSVAPAIRDGIRTVEDFKNHVAKTVVEVHDEQVVLVPVEEASTVKKSGRKTKKNE